MEALDCIFNRRSIRKFTDEKISDEALKTIIKAGHVGASCANTRDWKFIVVRNKELLNKMADANGAPATPLRNADVGILVCGDLSRSFPPANDYWIIDGAIAAQNMCLAAEAQGIGSVWLGTYPQEDRVEKQKALFDLPDDVVPHSIIAFGYPQENQNFHTPKTGRLDYEESQVVYYD